MVGLLNITSATSYEDISETVYGGDGEGTETINYKITAIDLEDNESGYSNTVEIEVLPTRSSLSRWNWI